MLDLVYGAKIKGIGKYFPQKILANSYLNEKFGFDLGFLENKIGISERRIASEFETASFMAIEAGKDLLNSAKLEPGKVDFLLLCTQNPDFRLPTTACIVQNGLGLKKSTFCFDINLGCSGFVYGLMIASNFVKLEHACNALIIMVDQYSKFLDPSDRDTVAIFGDAAAATLIQKCEPGFGVIDGVFGTDGSGAEQLIFRNSAVVNDPGVNGFIRMKGREVFKFVIRTVPGNVRELLGRHSIEVGDVKCFVFHQANRYILEEIKKRLGISDEQMVIEMKNYGNTVSATIPIAFEEHLRKFELRRGDYVVFSGFGVGLSWGSILYKMP